MNCYSNYLIPAIIDTNNYDNNNGESGNGGK